MIVRLKLNIGVADAKRLGLGKAHEGDEVEVPEKAATELLKNGWAVEATPPPNKVQAVPPVDLKTVPAAKPLPGK